MLEVKKINKEIFPEKYIDWVYSILKKNDLLRVYMVDCEIDSFKNPLIEPFYAETTSASITKELPEYADKALFIYALPEGKRDFTTLKTICETIPDQAFIAIVFQEYNNSYGDESLTTFSLLHNQFDLKVKKELIIRNNQMDRGPLNWDHSVYVLQKFPDLERRSSKFQTLGHLSAAFNTMTGRVIPVKNADQFYQSGYVWIDDCEFYYSGKEKDGLLVRRRRVDREYTVPVKTAIKKLTRRGHRVKMSCLVGNTTEHI